MSMDDEPILVETRVERRAREQAEHEATGCAALALGLLVLLPAICTVDLFIRLFDLNAKWYHVWLSSFLSTLAFAVIIGRLVSDNLRWGLFIILGLGTLGAGLTSYFLFDNAWMFDALKRMIPHLL